MTLVEALALLQEVKRESEGWHRLLRARSKIEWVIADLPKDACVATRDGNRFTVLYEIGDYDGHRVEHLVDRAAWEPLKLDVERQIARWDDPGRDRYPPLEGLFRS